MDFVPWFAAGVPRVFVKFWLGRRERATAGGVEASRGAHRPGTAAVGTTLRCSALVCKVSEEDIYSRHTGDEDGPLRPAFATALAARRDPYAWPAFLGRDTDAAEDVAALTVPGLWIFGGQDRSIPVDLSRRNLARLRARGHRFDEQLFRDLGHDNLAATIDAAVAWV